MIPAAADSPPLTPTPTRYDYPPLSLLLTLVVLPLYALDQVTKWLVIRHIDPVAEPRWIVPNWFALVHWSNTGAAWGAFANANPFFLALSALAVVVLAVLYRFKAFAPAWPRAGFALLLPGVLGNLTDRITHGHVVDFLLFDLHVPFAHPWPAFNVADSCICVAVFCFLIGSWRDTFRPS